MGLCLFCSRLLYNSLFAFILMSENNAFSPGLSPQLEFDRLTVFTRFLALFSLQADLLCPISAPGTEGHVLGMFVVTFVRSGCVFLFSFHKSCFFYLGPLGNPCGAQLTGNGGCRLVPVLFGLRHVISGPLAPFAAFPPSCRIALAGVRVTDQHYFRSLSPDLVTPPRNDVSPAIPPRWVTW